MNPALTAEPGNPPDDEYTCECGASLEGVETCSHHRCESCRDAFECHIECVVCHCLTDEHEFFKCVDCLVKADDAEEAERERDEARREDAHDEQRGDLIAACREWRGSC